VRADLFGLELTASTLPDEAEVAIVKMTELKARGLSFPKDHFGARNSSLADLKRLPLDEPEIDRRIVLDVLKGPDDATTVRTILALPFSLEQVAKGGSRPRPAPVPAAAWMPKIWFFRLLCG
jgi:predicted signal transduction protein with EAL and GGDEF domain